MSKLWCQAGLFGSVSVAFGSLLWSQQKSEPDQVASNCAPPDTSSRSPYELKLVQVLFRHGARTPLKSIPDVIEAQWVPTLLEPPSHTHINYVVKDLQGGPQPPTPVEDSYRKNILTGGTFPGQLTTVGMQQLYELGKILRRRYIEDKDFLSSTFSPAEVYVRSTNIVRTIESAKCLVAGLFHQKQTETVPILTTTGESEILYPNYYGCKLLKLLGSHRWAESATLPDIAADLKSIQSALGIAAHQRVDFILIRDDMVAREVTRPRRASRDSSLGLTTSGQNTQSCRRASGRPTAEGCSTEHPHVSQESVAQLGQGFYISVGSCVTRTMEHLKKCNLSVHNYFQTAKF